MLSSLRHSGSTPPYIFHLHYKQHSICDAGKVGSFDKTILNYEKVLLLTANQAMSIAENDICCVKRGLVNIHYMRT